MTPEQLTRLQALLRDLEGEFHHGDCVGADAEAHDIALGMAFDIVTHPPIVASKRAWKVGAIRTCAQRSDVARNKDIVRDTELLIAAPSEAEEQLRSGTWTTVRFARRKRRRIFIIHPDGTVVSEGGGLTSGKR